MKYLNLVLAAGALLATAVPAAAQTRDVLEPARATTGKLSAAEVVGGFSGTANNFGRRADADGDLIVVADDLTAGVVSISNVAFESANLLATTTIPNFTGVLDVAIEGDHALVLVERSNGAEGVLLMHFRRLLVIGSPTWIAAGQADVAADSFIEGFSNYRGFVELRDGVGVVAHSFGTGNDEVLFASMYDLTASAVNWITDTPVSPGHATSLAVGAAQGFLGGDEFAIALGIDNPNVGEIVVTLAASELSQLILLALIYQPAAPGTRFGDSVAVDGHLTVIGEPGADVGGTDTGRVLVFDHTVSTVTPIATLTSPTPTDGDELGRSVAINDAADLIALGERHSDAIVPTSSNSTGYVRFAVPTPSGTQAWGLTHDTAGFGAPLGGANENLGVDISFGADDLLIAGAPGTSTLNGYISWFALPSAPWVEVEQSPALAGTPGLPEMHMEGAVFADGPIVVGVRNAQPSSTTFVIIGLSAVFAPAKGGILYPSFDVLRMFPTNASGQFVVPSTWTSDFASFGPLDMHFQFWTLDPGAVSGFSATDGGVFHQY